MCVVFGSSTAGGAYLPGMSDYTIFVEGRARVFLGGPPLVKMAIGEEADEEELGGAAMHARDSGLCDYLAADEHEALRQARHVVAHLHWRRGGPGRPAARAAPLYHPDELIGVAPADVRVPFDVREVLARTLDGRRFEEFKSLYGAQLVCGWGSLAGFPLGVVANNGILFSEEAQKGAQFIALCNRIDTPILFVQNITGFMVGTRYEQGGIIKDGAKLINAVSNSTVPHLTLMVGASYGAGNYAMAGRAYEPRFVFTWPNHRIAVMGPKQLAGVLSIVRRNAAEAAGRPFDEAADEALRRHRGADRGGVDGPVRHRPAVGRRDHRPPRHPHRAVDRPGAPALGRRSRAPPSSGWSGTDGRRRSGPRLLVANRGEIARRVLRGARVLGIETVAVFAEDDRSAPARGRGRPGGVPRRRPAVGHLPRRRPGCSRPPGGGGADALHPGYGFLSEDPRLAEACAAAGIAWVGPPPAAMAAMAHKARAKATVAAAGVPVLRAPWCRPTTPPRAGGWPPGGGGRVPAAGEGLGRGRGPGMRLVEGPGELADAVAAARREAAASFGSDEVFLERYVRSPRHVEVQVVADRHGHVVHLFDRECSIQRRHQKVIEEAPAALVPDGLRAVMWEAAVDAARAVAYEGVGTVEFVVGGPEGGEGAGFFLEMNTRLQVEHGVTELVTGLDLVDLQLRVAAGRPLAFAQEEVAVGATPSRPGSAPSGRRDGYRPTPGRVAHARWPGGRRAAGGRRRWRRARSVGAAYD